MSDSVTAEPAGRLTANQSHPPPPTVTKSPHWWSNHASPVTAMAWPPIVSVPAACIVGRE